MPVINTIKEARTARNLDKETLAKAVRCSPKTISRCEAGQNCPSLELALRLSRYLEISTDKLFQLDNDISESITKDEGEHI